MDERVVAQAVRGDRQALAWVLRDLQDPIYRVCVSLLGDAERARDATQESALRLVRDISSFRGASSIQTFAIGIAINVAREMRRSRQSIGLERASEVSDRGPGPDERLAGVQERAAVRQALDELPERQREAVMLRFFEGLSVEQTADAMKCAAGTVKATVHQALRVLRERFKTLPAVGGEVRRQVR